jgi:hypothetical protein
VKTTERMRGGFFVFIGITTMCMSIFSVSHTVYDRKHFRSEIGSHSL